VTPGFYGKLPARGDFVRAGLPRDFTDRWDDWLQSVIAGSRTLMGEAWLPAFLEAPIWRFSLPPGLCGERAVLGLMLPSVDKAGRYFPLTFAALLSGGAASPDSAAAIAWLDQCEAVGCAALEQDTAPQEISELLGVADFGDDANAAAGGVWWSEGSPRVEPARMTLDGMPDAAAYAAMLGADADGRVATTDESGQEVSGGTRWESTS
jgi:type VI secretion system protein ImpM